MHPGKIKIAQISYTASSNTIFGNINEKIAALTQKIIYQNTIMV